MALLKFTRGKAVLMYIPTVSLECSQLFLEEIVTTDEAAIHIVIWDGAGFHQKPLASDVPSQVRLLPLPPYCPELNPMEKLWDIVKGHIGNKVFETLTSIESEITDVLRAFLGKCGTRLWFARRQLVNAWRFHVHEPEKSR